MSPFEAGQIAQAAWRKASFCASGECVEVTLQGGAIILRDSAEPQGKILHCSVDEWRSFVRNIKDGKFDAS